MDFGGLFLFVVVVIVIVVAIAVVVAVVINLFVSVALYVADIFIWRVHRATTDLGDFDVSPAAVAEYESV